MKNAIFLLILIAAVVVSAEAQRTTLTGTAVIYGSGFSTRTITRPFTLIINGQTAPEDVTRQLRTLEHGGQDDLLHQIHDSDLGRFSLGAGVGVPVNTIVVENNGDDLRIRAIFARWMGFGELRYGLRSTDYPFSYVDLHINPRTGKGDGTFIPAARIRSKGGDTIEVEDFGTFPGRLMGVKMHGSPLR